MTILSETRNHIMSLLILVLLIPSINGYPMSGESSRDLANSERPITDVLVLYRDSWRLHAPVSWANFEYGTRLLMVMNIGYDTWNLDRDSSPIDYTKYRVVLISSAREWGADFAMLEDSIRDAVENDGVGLVVVQLPQPRYLTPLAAQVLGIAEQSTHESHGTVQDAFTSSDLSTRSVLGYFHSVSRGQYSTWRSWVEWSTNLTTAVPLAYYNATENAYFVMNQIGKGRVFAFGASVNSGNLISDLIGAHNFEFVLSLEALLPNWRRSSDYKEMALMLDDLNDERIHTKGMLDEILNFAKDEKVKVGLGAVVSTVPKWTDQDKSVFRENSDLIEIYYHGMYHAETYDGYRGGQDEFYYQDSKFHVPYDYQLHLVESMVANASRSGLRLADYFVPPSDSYDNNTVAATRRFCLTMLGDGGADMPASDLPDDPLLSPTPVLSYNGTGVFRRYDPTASGSNFTTNGMRVARSFLTLKIPLVLYGHTQQFSNSSGWRQVIEGIRAVEPALRGVFPSTILSTYFTYKVLNGASYFQTYLFGKEPVAVLINGTAFHAFNRTVILTDLSKAAEFTVLFQYPDCRTGAVTQILLNQLGMALTGMPLSISGIVVYADGTTVNTGNVTVYLDDHPASVAPIKSDGSFTTDLLLPMTLSLGAHTVKVTHTSGGAGSESEAEALVFLISTPILVSAVGTIAVIVAYVVHRRKRPLSFSRQH